MIGLQVMTESGMIQGIRGWDPHIFAYKGIPYARPPVGELRWRAPQKSEPWTGVKDCTIFRPMAMQRQPGEDPDDFWSVEIHPTGKEFDMSEDCLYLNVFTPARSEDENLPVYVYIHGGGYRGGYPYEIEFDWEHMAAKGIVCVSVAYRLGVLGFLAHPEISSRYPEEAIGNYGILDQLAALQWVKRNIRKFGGNPDQITIGGQSAGAGSVQNLLSAPAAAGLFQGAVLESGVSVSDGEERHVLELISREQAEKTGAEFWEKAGIKSLEEARGLSAGRLIELEQEIFGDRICFQPVMDLRLHKEYTGDALKRGHWAPVPVIAGYNQDELVWMKHMDKSAAVFGEIWSRLGNQAFIYEFCADVPGKDRAGSFHGAEMWFVFDSLARSWRPFTGRHYDLARKINGYWINFIRTGNPNGETYFGEKLAEWNAFTDETKERMLLMEIPHMEAFK